MKTEVINKSPREWLPAPLEAYCLLTIENYYQMTQDTVNDEENISEPKWTSNGKGMGRKAGWDEEGIDRYNDLYDMVQENRRLGGARAAELRYLREKKRKYQEERDQVRKRKLDALSQQGAKRAKFDYSGLL